MPNAALKKTNRRSNKRFSVKKTQAIIAQHNWENFVQIRLTDKTVFLGQIMNISTNGIGLKVAFDFDVFEPIRVDLSFSSKKAMGSSFAYDTFDIRASIVRSKLMDDSFSMVGLIFGKEGKRTEEKLQLLINQIC